MTESSEINSREAEIAQLRSLINSSTEAGDQGGGWDAAWKESVTPWDRNAAQPTLVGALKEGSQTDKLIPREGRALVAGCGRGYDAELLAKRGLEATGVDISRTAVQKADEWLESLPADAAHQRLRFVQADFFKLGKEDEGNVANMDIAEGGWDVAYDYTFFCAIPASFHEQWAASYKRLIKPGGVLIALVFPIQGDRPGGPPYSVSPEQYKTLLSDSFELVHHDDTPAGQPEERKGVEALMIWKRK